MFATINVIYVFTQRPIRDQNSVEVFNELTVWLCAYIIDIFLNIEVAMSSRDILGWVLMGLSLLNIVVNLSIVGFISTR